MIRVAPGLLCCQSILEIKKMGSVLRSRGDRVCGLRTNGTVVACHGKSSHIDLFTVLPDEEVKAKRTKRLNKSQKRERYVCVCHYLGLRGGQNANLCTNLNNKVKYLAYAL